MASVVSPACFEEWGKFIHASEDGTLVTCSSTAGLEKYDENRALAAALPLAADATVGMHVADLGTGWFWASFFTAPPGGDTHAGSPGVYSVDSDAGSCYGDGAWSKNPLPPLRAGDRAAWRLLRNAGRIEVSVTGGPFIVVFDGITAAVVSFGVYLIGDGVSIRLVSVD